MKNSDKEELNKKLKKVVDSGKSERIKPKRVKHRRSKHIHTKYKGISSTTVGVKKVKKKEKLVLDDDSENEFVEKESIENKNIEVVKDNKVNVVRPIKHRTHKKEKILTKPIIVLMIIASLLILFNQVQVNSISNMVGSGVKFSGYSGVSLSGSGDLNNIDLSAIRSTGQTIATVFPVEDIKTQEDAMAIIFPTGTPDYGAELGVSFDDPVGSLATLSKMYRSLKTEVQKNNPEGWNRYMNMALKPVGISCEFCCGLKAVGVDKNGNSACGCQHNPALLSVALYLSAYSDYTDGEILREVMRWKTLFFPRDMINLGMTVAGGDDSALNDLPGMVGGC